MRQRDWKLNELAACYNDVDTKTLPLIVDVSYIDAYGDRDMLHRHLDFAALMIVRRGRGRYVRNGTVYGISPGDVYVMGQGTAHQWEEFDDLVISSLYFSPQLFDPATLQALRETPGFLPLFVEEPLRRGLSEEGGRWLHLTPEEHARVEAEIAEITAEWDATTPLSGLLVRGLFLRLLAHLAHIYTGHQNHSEAAAPTAALRRARAHKATLAAAIEYMEAHFAEDITVEGIAAAVFLSPGHFREVFAQSMGRAPRDYLRHLRIERAKTLLVTTDIPITEIGLVSGLSEPSYFARVFRAGTGMTPREYRAAAQPHG